jgi:adenylylsulfate kinase-like enzyme
MAPNSTAENLASLTSELANRIEKLIQRQTSNPRQRMLVALAGVPGSGKSTVSHALLQELASRGVKNVTIAPMVSLV